MSFSFFKRKSKEIPFKPEVVRIEPQSMSMNDWRAKESLVNESRKLAQHAIFKSQLDILRNEHPAKIIFRAIGVSTDDRLAHQARIEGYELCLVKLELFAKPMKSKETIHSTFEPPIQEQGKK